ncbi:hypothetical protein niasHT_032894 [Heterodera trifolii]|uniref:Uncharacterized protein n=1 Tax=Heterodera trifolii TaxID=157864 RepID=A0ABD2INU4_9BILA
MSDNPNEAEEKMAKAIFISADCWLCVFELLPPRKLGLGISMISHRFDFYVDEHFKTRKWALKCIGIRRKMGKNGTKQIEIIKYFDGKPLPIPQIQMPRKVIGFERIDICFIDRNAIAFLHRFFSVFANFSPNVQLGNLNISMTSDRILEFILRNIWPMLAKNICGMFLFVNVLHRLRKFVPSILNDCPSLRVVFTNFDECFVEFPCDDNAMASDGQAVAKWLFTPRPDGVPKVFKCLIRPHDGNWSSKIEASKAAFASASSPVNFIIVILFPLSFAVSDLPFDLTNELTREQLALKRINNTHRFLLIRCPIARDESKWTKWEEEAIGWRICNQWNAIFIQITDENKIGDGLLDTIPGPSDH